MLRHPTTRREDDQSELKERHRQNMTNGRPRTRVDLVVATDPGRLMYQKIGVLLNQLEEISYYQSPHVPPFYCRRSKELMIQVLVHVIVNMV